MSGDNPSWDDLDHEVERLNERIAQLERDIRRRREANAINWRLIPFIHTMIILLIVSVIHESGWWAYTIYAFFIAGGWWEYGREHDRLEEKYTDEVLTR